MRSCDDIDEQALSYAEIKALCAGDPRIREKMDLDVQVAKLKVLRGDFQNQKYRLEDKLLKTFPEEIQKQKTRIAALQQDSQIATAHPQDKENFCGMTIKGMVYDDKKAAGERLLLARQEMPNADMMLLGTYSSTKRQMPSRFAELMESGSPFQAFSKTSRDSIYSSGPSRMNS